MATLPTPATSTEVWLAAVHEEIVGLRADLASSRGGEQPPAPGQQLLEEPTTAKTRRSTKST